MNPMDLVSVVVAFLVLFGLLATVAWAAYRRHWRTVKICGGFLFFLLLMIGGSAMELAEHRARLERTPPDYRTRMTIDVTALQIQDYMREHRIAPPSLSALPQITSPPTDAWGRELLYSVDKEGVVTLGSYGRDGKPRGKGLDRDIIYRFRTRTDDGLLNVDEWRIHWIGRAPLDGEPVRSKEGEATVK